MNKFKKNKLKVFNIVEGEYRERKRIAQFIHDNVVSDLMALKINTQSLALNYPVLNQSPHHQNLLLLTTDIMLELREFTHDIMPTDLKKNGLHATIEKIIEKFQSDALQITLEFLGSPFKLPEIIEKQLVQAIQELIHNIVKHAEATKAYIQLSYFEAAIGLVVKDNGIGLPEHYQKKETLGLNKLIENIELINGIVKIESSRKNGTTIYLEISLSNIY